MLDSSVKKPETYHTKVKYANSEHSGTFPAAAMYIFVRINFVVKYDKKLLAKKEQKEIH